MNDGYEEILVKKGRSAKDSFLKGMVISVVVILAVVGILFFAPIFIIAAMVLGLLAYYLILPNLDIEYEYLYVGGDIDIDKIMAKRKRKTIASFSKDNLEVMAPTGSDHLSEYMKGAAVKDYTSGNPDVKTWTLVYSSEKTPEIVRMELNEGIAQDMRRYAPRKVFFD